MFTINIQEYGDAREDPNELPADAGQTVADHVRNSHQGTNREYNRNFGFRG